MRAAGADFGDAESDETWEDPRGRGRRGRGRGNESGGRGRREGQMEEKKEFEVCFTCAHHACFEVHASFLRIAQVCSIASVEFTPWWLPNLSTAGCSKPRHQQATLCWLLRPDIRSCCVQERVVQVSRVTKVVKGGKSMSFR